MNMKRNAAFFLIPLIFLLSCGTETEENNQGEVLVQAKGDRLFGGVFRLNESEYIKNLFPHNITDAYS